LADLSRFIRLTRGISAIFRFEVDLFGLHGAFRPFSAFKPIFSAYAGYSAHLALLSLVFGYMEIYTKINIDYIAGFSNSFKIPSAAQK